MAGAAIGPRGGAAPRRGWPQLAVILAAGLGQLVVLVPFTIASGLVAPLWAVVGLHVVWLLFAVLFVRLLRRRPLATPLVPVANAAVLWLVITIGEAALGWTA